MVGTRGKPGRYPCDTAEGTNTWPNVDRTRTPSHPSRARECRASTSTRPNSASRFLKQFADPRFDDAKTSLDEIAAIAFRNYEEGRKAPNSHPAGPGYADPAYELSDDWRAARGGDRPGADANMRTRPSRRAS